MIVGRHPREIALALGTEIGAVLVFTIFLSIVLPLVLPGGPYLFFARPFWLDEYHSALLAAETVPAMLRKLQHGADFNPPLLYLMLRPLAKAGGGLSELDVRLFSLASVLAALNLLYWTLRPNIPRAACLAGVIVVWSHPAVAEHAFEGRFYGPMMAFTAFVAFLLSKQARRGWLDTLLLIAGSAALCGIHYFGVIVLGLIAAGSLVADRTTARRALLCLASGLITVGACIPFYVGQKDALTVPTWVPEASAPRIITFLSLYYGWLPFALLITALAVGMVVAGSRTDAPTGAPHRERLLFALLLLPLVLVVFSVLVQPVLIMRYAIATTLGFGALVASVAGRQPLRVQAAVLFLVCVMSFGGVGRQYAKARAEVRDLDEVAGLLEEIRTVGEMAVVSNRRDIYPLALTLDVDDLVLLEGSDDDFANAFAAQGTTDDLARFFTVESDVARVHSRLFGFPQVMSLEAVRQLDSFLILDPNRSDISPKAFMGAVFPSFTVAGAWGGHRRLLRLVRVRP